MSVGSIAGGIFLPAISLVMEPLFFPEALVIGVIVVLKHRANIVRLIHGEEPVMSIFDKKNKTDSQRD